MLFNVRTDRGVWKRHLNQLQVRLTNVPQEMNHSRQDLESQSERPTSAPVSNDPPPRRYPRRQRRPPDFYVAH